MQNQRLTKIDESDIGHTQDINKLAIHKDLLELEFLSFCLPPYTVSPCNLGSIEFSVFSNLGLI